MADSDDDIDDEQPELPELNDVPNTLLEVVSACVFDLDHLDQEEEELCQHGNTVENDLKRPVVLEDSDQERSVEAQQVDVEHLLHSLFGRVELVVDDSHDGGLLEQGCVADHLGDDVAQREVVEHVVFFASFVHKLQLLTQDQMSEIDVGVVAIVQGDLFFISRQNSFHFAIFRLQSFF